MRFKQTWLLAGIGLLDLVSTLWFLHRHGAAEANPLMICFLAHGTLAFVLAKLGFLAGPLAVLEWAGRRRPLFVRRAANVAIFGYVTLYLCGVARLNIVPPPSNTNPELRAAWAQIQRRIREKNMRVQCKKGAASREEDRRALPASCRDRDPLSTLGIAP